MHLILLSGGSGKRLWPLSNDVRSKQFLKLLKAPNGEPESMVQRVYRQLREVGGWDSITVAAGASQKDQIESQLGENVNLVIEPERRDTFPAIALAASFLYSECGVTPKETIAVLPVDPYVEETFFEAVQQIESEFEKTDADLVLLGAKPLFPSEKYGYIVPDGTGGNVKSFKEKPDWETSKQLIEQGALWNCGVFGLKLGYIQKILSQKYNRDYFEYSIMKDFFVQLNKTSFDYEVVEKADKIRVIQYDGPWKDLGTWETFTEEIEDAISGNVVIDTTCRNTHIINEQELPVVAMGIEDAVIVASLDGILVASKGKTAKLKEITTSIKNRPMYEERRWGQYMVLDHTNVDGFESLTKRIILNEGKQISYQYHNCRSEVWTIVAGQGIVYIDNKKKAVKPGDVIQIATGVKHGMKALTELELIEVQLGKNLVEEDIIRLEMEW
ncbi:sugar phosphate nucleotidyltransferase [Clostridium aminobutyricum]|uniref:Cupin domain-containing protein n=1 Tax=Clostridium aminobutyricum TaxID=33953 RepID=A0A939DB49_CLOAM|nr:sugar phosphate nucleotidyltransferase [Clostridium aminobutyricum]MBN7774053.1 cupin domain-containing protein [Clostridium aminobutyricum]